MSEIIARLQTKSLCSAPRLQCKSYWWPIIGHQCLKNLQSKIFLEQHLDCKSCKMWTNQISQDGSGAVAPAKLNHLKISLCQSKLTHGLIVQREWELSESTRWKLEIQYFLKIRLWRAQGRESLLMRVLVRQKVLHLVQLVVWKPFGCLTWWTA